MNAERRHDEVVAPGPARDELRRSSWGRRCYRLLVRSIRCLGAVFLLYGIIILAGLIPVNNDFRPSPDGIEVLLVSNAVHADVVLPLETPGHNWRSRFAARDFPGNISAATHLAVGWGDRGFYLETPTWSDLRLTTATRALFWPSATCLHVVMTRPEFLPGDARRVKISPEQYSRLVEFIERDFQRNPDGSFVYIDGFHYGADDAFYQARGTYHCLNTCNCWIGRAMQAGGMRTGWLTPLPKSNFIYLPR